MLWRICYTRTLPPGLGSSGPWNARLEADLPEQQERDSFGPFRELRQELARRFPGSSERSFDVLSCEPCEPERV